MGEIQKLPVSIVIPFLNEEHSLPLLIDAVLNLTVLPNEIIFVDSGSVDQSVNIIQERQNDFTDINIEIISLQNSFPGASRNMGIKKAKEEWVAFLDAGVIPQNDWLEQLWEKASNSEIEIVWGNCIGTPESRWPAVIALLSYGIGKKNPYVIPASLFKKSIFTEIGFFREDLRAYEDVVWRKKIFSSSDIRYEVADNAVVEYGEFPSNLFKAMSKWFVYATYAMKSGVAYKQLFLYFFLLIVFISAIAAYPAPGVLLLTAYAVFRGIILPIRKTGENYNLWKAPALIPILPIAALLLDCSKLCGMIWGIFFCGRKGNL